MAKAIVPSPLVLAHTPEGDPVTTTAIISHRLGRRHNDLMKLVRENITELERHGTVRFETSRLRDEKLRGSRKTEVALLNEEQFAWLLMQMRPKRDQADKVREAQHEFIAAFRKMKQLLMRAGLARRDESWIAPRLELKEATKHRSEAVQDYVNYAVAQGSQGYRSNPERGFILFAKLAQSAVVTIPPELGKTNPREFMSERQLVRLAQAEEVIDVALRDGMRRSLPYKQIYDEVKQKLETWAELFGVQSEPLAA